MATPHNKPPSRPRPAPSASRPPPRRRSPTVELPFEDPEVLNVAQYPTEVRRVAPKRPEQEAIPTTVYELSEDQELSASYGGREVTDPGHKPAFLYVEKGPGQGQLVPVNQGSLVIGRASVSELRLQHPSVSRRHAQVTRLGERFYLKDLGSQNSTFVNKVKIETEIEIYPGDQLQIGSAVLKLRGPAEKVPEHAKKQIDKAVAKSAKRQAVRAPAVASGGTNKLLLAAACTAIGFGLAAVVLFLILNFKGEKLLVQQPSAAQVAAAPAARPEAPPEVHAEARAQTQIQEQEQEQVQVEAASPTVEPEPSAQARPEASAAQLARHEQRRPVHRATRHEASPAQASEESGDEGDVEEDAAAEAGKSGDNAEVLKLYEAGEVSGAIAAARASGDRDLAKKLTDFQASSAAAQRAEKAGDGTAAIKAYQQALAADEKISGGWGKHGPAISRKLGHLYDLVGQYYQREGDPQNARLAFQAALKYDPSNDSAKQHLAQAQTSTQAAKNAIEDVWND